MDVALFMQFLIPVVSAAALMSPLVVVAYLLGRRSLYSGKSSRFHRLTPELRIGNALWRVEGDGDDAGSPPYSFPVELLQEGCRIYGSGHSPVGTSHSLEGMLIGRSLHYIFLDEGTRDANPGVILVHAESGGHVFKGIRCRWSLATQTMLIRPVTLTKTGSIPVGQ